LTLLGIFLIIGSVVTSPYFQLTIPVEAIQVSREIDRPNFFQGDFMHVKITVKNTGSTRIDSIHIYDVYPEVFRLVLGSNSIRTRIDPGNEIKFSYILQSRLRGKYTIGPTKFHIYDRLEFRFEEISAENFDDLLVYPSVQDVRIMESLAQKRRIGYLFGIHKTRQTGMGTDFIGIRRYLSGDEYRRIDWKSSARTSKLMIRQYETERNMRIFIILDTGASMGAGRPENSKLEFAIRAALLLSNAAMERKDHVGLLTWSTKNQIYLKPELGEAHYQRILEILAAIKPEGEFDLTAAIEYLIKHVKKNCFFIILSDCESNQQRLLKGIQLIRGYNNQAIIISPFGPWFEILEIYLTPVERAIGEALVHRLLEERASLAKSLRRANVPLLPVGPGDILPTILSEYLKAKKRRIAVI
jgi:uncharacterized protein (DUF58 family)